MTAVLRSAFLCLALCACAGSMTPGLHSTPLLELALADVDGRTYELGALEQKPRLLFLFATYDEVSQVALVPLAQFARTNPRVEVLGLALQPEARTFLKLYERSFSVPFALYYDPENVVLQGKTALGHVPGVPAYVALDADNRVRATQFGAATADDLHTLAKQALDH